MTNPTSRVLGRARLSGTSCRFGRGETRMTNPTSGISEHVRMSESSCEFGRRRDLHDESDIRDIGTRSYVGIVV